MASIITDAFKRDFSIDGVETGGVEPFAMFVKQQDWLAALDVGTITTDPVTGYVNSIDLTTGNRGYVINGVKPSNVAPVETWEQREGNVDGWRNSVSFVSFNTNPHAVANIENMRHEGQVAIVKSMDGKYWIVGEKIGLLLAGGEFNPGDIANGNAIPFTLATHPEWPLEPNKMRQLWAGSIAATEAIITKLQSPAV